MYSHVYLVDQSAILKAAETYIKVANKHRFQPTLDDLISCNKNGLTHIMVSQADIPNLITGYKYHNTRFRSSLVVQLN